MKARGAIIGKLLAGEDMGPPSFDISAARKDLDAMVAFGKETGAALPVASATLSCYQEAERAGLAGADPMALPVFWVKRAAGN
jgi:3-hydroxyisobutyrate dehydrogenase